MKISVMQPYIFPYLGYFSLILASDVFVSLDEVQYIRRGWMNRNKIIRSTFSSEYIRINTIKADQKTKISEIKINQEIDWKDILLSNLKRYSKAPFYEEVMIFIKDLLEYDSEYLAEFNLHTLKVLSKKLNLNTKFLRSSDLDFPRFKINSPEQWGLEISKTLKGDTYINLPGGSNLYSRKRYFEEGIRLEFITNNFKTYSQFDHNFIERLSVIDSLMFNGFSGTRKLIEDYTVGQEVEDKQYKEIV